MSDLKEKLKRQTEILGICLNQPNEIKPTELETYFGRDKPTITRDLGALRSNGIDIHSTKKGIILHSKIGQDILVETILQYIGISYSSFSYDKATTFLVKRLKERALINIVMLQRCIDQGAYAYIDYELEPGIIEKSKRIAPYLLYQSENEWRLLASRDEKQRQYLVYKIKKISPSDEPFPKPSINELRKEFNTSWNSWLSGDKYSIKLKFDEEVIRRYGQRYFVEDQKITPQKNGSFIFEAKVNSLDEVAAWIISRGGGITIVSPKKLRSIVIAMAKDIISLHR